MADLMAMVHTERRSLAEFLAGLGAEEWDSPTCCPKWTVKDLVGHLTASGHITAPHFFAGFIRSGFDFDRFVDADRRRYSVGTPSQVLAGFEAIVDSNRKPPGPAYVALGEVMVHGEDVRRAIDKPGEHPVDHLTTLADMYCKTGPPLGATKRLAGLRLVATDVEWSSGDGAEVRGPCMSLILAMVGRPAPLDDCDGDGVPTLRSRCKVA